MNDKSNWIIWKFRLGDEEKQFAINAGMMTGMMHRSVLERLMDTKNGTRGGQEFRQKRSGESQGHAGMESNFEVRTFLAPYFSIF